MDSNHRPRAYQARALATWATDRYSLMGYLFVHLYRLWWDSNLISRAMLERSVSVNHQRQQISLYTACGVDWNLVEMMGFEPMTPCLQGRCSPNWATPPYLLWVCSLRLRLKPDNWTTDSISTHEYTSLSRFLPNSTTSAQLNFCYVSLTVSIERRWSSRTFRYGYLVTT